MTFDHSTCTSASSEDHRTDELKAMQPFEAGEAEILLVPNKTDGEEAAILVVSNQDGETASNQLSIEEARRMADYLNRAAEEAELLERCTQTTP